jgi:WhiB family transcriptional regulator, redox-sensing transcriptional regulator
MPIADEYNWRAHGACVTADPELFFPISSSGASRPQEERAKAVCASCRVRRECLDYALASHQVHGVWGGLGEIELAAMRRRRAGSGGTPGRERIPGTGRVSRGTRRRQSTEYERAAS